nr:hypothetical protein [Luteibacter rhizovicinus]
MNLRTILWSQPRDVFLYSCEAYRIWMVESQRSSLADTVAEYPLAGYAGFVLFSLVTVVYPDARHLNHLAIASVFIFAGVATHIYLKQRWGLASVVFARYRRIPYFKSVIVDAIMVLMLVLMLAATSGSPMLTLCVVVVHWLMVGTVFYALLERRRMPDQQETL